MISRALSLLLAALCLVTCSPPAEGTKVGERAKDFTVKEVGSGKEVKLSNYKDKVVLLDFWATWCGPCKALEPEIQAAYDKYHDQGFEVISVSIEPLNVVEKYGKERKTRYPIHHDFAGMATGAFPDDAYPVQYLIGRDGIITWSQRGYGPGDLEKAVDEAMKR